MTEKRRLFFFMIGTAAFLSWLTSPIFGSSFPQTSPEAFFKLNNGLKVLIIDRKASPLAHVVLAVGLGSRDESPSTYGLAHFLEHAILFRGERSKPVEAIQRELRKKGGWINGHTSQDLTLFELSIPAPELESGMAALCDLVFNLKLSEEDVQEEKEIILEEMNLQAAEPFPLGVSLAYEHLFPGHPYGHPIIGTRESLTGLGCDEIMAAYHNFYHPSNCVLVGVVDSSTGKVKELVEKYFGQLEAKKVERHAPEKIPALPKTPRIERQLDIQQSHLFVACRAPDITSLDQYAFDLLTTIFGRGPNPLLPLALARRRVQVAGSYISYYSHRYAGVLLLHFVLDAKQLASAEREAIQFLRQAYRENYSPDDVLGEAREYVLDFVGSARNMLRLNAEKNLADGRNLASVAATYLLLLEGSSLPSYSQAVESLESTDLRKVASKYLARPELVTIVINPLHPAGKKADEQP